MAGIKVSRYGCRRAAPGVHAGCLAVGTAGAPSCVREESNGVLGRENGIHSDLQIAISTILKPTGIDKPEASSRWT